MVSQRPLFLVCCARRFICLPVLGNKNGIILFSTNNTIFFAGINLFGSAFAALCLHWFNPLVWQAFASSGKDMEMSCDEAVMKKFGKNDTKSRIKNVLNYKKPWHYNCDNCCACLCAYGSVFHHEPDCFRFEKNSSPSGSVLPNIIFGDKENTFQFGYQQITPEEEKVIKEEIKKSNDSGYPEEFDVSCCNFVNLKKVASEQDGMQTATYYGWSYYAEYKYGEGGLEMVSGSHTPEALTFRIDETGYHLEEYWIPGDGDDYYTDIQNKFPGYCERCDGRREICTGTDKGLLCAGNLLWKC